LSVGTAVAWRRRGGGEVGVAGEVGKEAAVEERTVVHRFRCARRTLFVSYLLWRVGFVL